MRHFNSGIDCAMAGAAIVAAPATLSPVTLIKSLRFMLLPSQKLSASAFFCRGLSQAWNIWMAISILDQTWHAKNPAPSRGPGLALSTKGLDQLQVRERVMKLSKVYSATCHQRRRRPARPP